ncbi:MAG: protoporphyrinogen oxidase [Nocardioides sp.]|nr:protoporphyrinogen oxidase [Nocardioides sp.]
MSALVVGGGIAGLSAALTLARAGQQVTVLEASGRLGGKVHTVRVDDYLLETGPDSFVSYKPAARALAVALGLEGDLIGPSEPREVFLHRSAPAPAGRMVPLPQAMGLVLPTRLGPLATTRLLSPAQKLRAGLDVVLPRRLGEADVSVGEFLTARLGRAVVDALADPLFGGIHGTSVDELSLDAVLPQLRAHEAEHRSLVLASLRQGRAARRSLRAGGGSPFLSLRGGMGTLVEVLAARLRELGVDLRVDTPATADDLAAAGLVVLAAPAPAVAGLLGDLLPGAALQAGRVRHATTAVAHLGVPLDSFRVPPAGHGFLEAGPDRAVFSGCTWSSNKWPGRAPEGHALARVFLPQRSSALVGRSDDEVFSVVEEQLARVIGPFTPRMRHLTRWRDAMPVYEVGHLGRVALLEQEVATRRGWALAGASWRGVGVPDAIASGTRAAEAVLASVT